MKSQTTKSFWHPLGKYLNSLIGLHLVERAMPITVRHPEHSRKGHYRIADPYLRFYFRFLAPNQEWIEQGRMQQVWQHQDVRL